MPLTSAAALNHVFAMCLSAAAQNYSVPPAVLVGILHVEGGRIGQMVRNKNGSYDLGPMQINTTWMPMLADAWNVDPRVAMRWVRDDGCTNVNVAAWILRQNLDETKSLSKAISYYHSRTPSRGSSYRNKVVAVLRKKGLLTPSHPQQTASSAPVQIAERDNADTTPRNRPQHISLR